MVNNFYIFKFFLAILIYLFFILQGNGAEIYSGCPQANPKENVFNSSAIERNSRISIERNNSEYPISLIFYQPKNNSCSRSRFAKYPIEGGVPTIDSLFFMPVRGRMNVFSIVKWHFNNRGDGSYGDLYQIYSYYLDGNGMLVENKLVSTSDAMSGIEGVVQGGTSKFKYKTASDVREYWYKFR